MAFQGIPLGRASQLAIIPGVGEKDAPIQIIGLKEYLRDASKASDRFNTEARKASVQVAEKLLVGVRMEASTVTRNRQALEVVKGLRAYSDRIPTIKLNDKSGFVSQSRPNRKRKTKVTRGDVFFGAEFGGGSFGPGNRTTPHKRKEYQRVKGEPKSSVLVRTQRKGGGTTTQFLRHRGRSGYFFWPTVRKMKNEIAIEYLNAIDRVLDTLAER